MAKRVFTAAGLRCPDGVVTDIQSIERADPMARPYVVKPANEGSSVGVRIVRSGDNQPVRAADWRYDPRVVVERFVPGRELTVAVMGDRPLAVTELRTGLPFYDYEAKYTAGKTEHLIPAPVSKAVYDEALRMAKLAHEALGCRGVSRSDFRYDDTGKGGIDQLYLLEVNTQPGMTPLSLAPEQAQYLGISFSQLVSWMVENARCDA
jgi:D-alanine-D-alanine ligase